MKSEKSKIRLQYSSISAVGCYTLVVYMSTNDRAIVVYGQIIKVDNLFPVVHNKGKKKSRKTRNHPVL